MQVNQLIVEVGRKCNLNCTHCLRGASQDITIDVQTAKNLIDEFDYIGSITFTGGEPTLYSKEIIELIDYILDNKKNVAGFYIASNGQKFDIKLMLKLCEFYAYILENYDEESAEFSKFDLSTDQFHPTLDVKIKSLYKGFAFVDFRDEITEGGIINEGNAANNGIGYRNLRTDYSFNFDEEWNEVKMVYLNAKGYLLPDCDYSYETQDYMEPFKYGERPLVEIFKQFNAAKAA